MPRPRATEHTITTRIVDMVKVGPMSSREIANAIGVKTQKVHYYLRHHINDGHVSLVNIKSSSTRCEVKRCWCWTETESCQNKFAEKKYKCLVCRKSAVPGGPQWVCGQCKNTDVWRSSSPYAIA